MDFARCDFLPGVAASCYCRRTLARAVAVALLALGASARAAPVGEQVTAGEASVIRSGNHTLIHQGSERAVLNWQSFNIGAGESVRFAQPSASSIALNRVLGQNPTEIHGSLSANGQVFLVNPNGVLFGRGAQIDVGGLVASTLNLNDADFMGGRYRFVKDGHAGGVRNAGSLIANGGYVALIGPQVGNEGTITAVNGSVVLAAGEQATLNLNGNQLIGLTVDRGTVNALAHNRGLIQADGGQVLLTAKAADQLIKSVVNNDGVIEAGTLRRVNGEIHLMGDAVTNSGTLYAQGAADEAGGRIQFAAQGDVTLTTTSQISASGARGGDVTVQARSGTLLADGRFEAKGHDGAGGSVHLLGERVALLHQADVDVSGKTAGGRVLIGGDFQGNNPRVQNASRTHVGADVRIRADALEAGDGGKVIVWADGATRFQGTISAQGGAQSGNGGLVEVSGKATLDFAGDVNTSAANGKFGTLLLDPTNITVVAGATPNPPNASDGLWAFGEDAGNQNIGAGAINTLLAANNLTLQATNNITVSSAISYTGATNRTLTLQANNNITVSSGISATAARLNLVLNADADSAGGGTAAVNAALVTRQGNVNITGASVTSTAAGTINTSTGVAGSTGGNVVINATGAISLAGAITASGTAGGAGQAGGNAGNVTITGASTVTTGAITAAGGAGGSGAGFAGGNGGAITVSSSGTLTTGALQANGGNGGGTTAAGGNAGSISVSNGNAAGGTVTTGTLTARTGAAVGAISSGAAGSINVNNAANTVLQAGAIDTRGQAGGNGGDVSLVSAGNVTETSTIQTGGGSLNAGTVAAGRGAGNVTISGVNRTLSGAIIASGGAGFGANQAGGKAGVVSITGSGTLNTAAITARTGAATGTGAGGAVGSITANGTTVTTGALTTTGGANGNGGAISITSSSGATTINGAVASSGGAANAGVAGRNAGAVVINSAGNLTGTGLAVTASGSNANGAGLNLAGGHGGLIDIDAAGTITLGNIAASGGNASTTNAAGGNAGSILITNNSAATGAMTTGTLTARNGAAQGTGAGGAAGVVTLVNNAAGQAINTGAINTSGQTSGAGGNVVLSSQGNVTVSSTITTSGAALGAGTVAAGRAAGNVTITGVNRSVAGAITASGGAGLGANQAGGQAGLVSITGSGTLSTAAISASTGAATGTGAGGTAGGITLSGSTVSAGALTTTGGANGNGGAVNVSAASGAVNLTGAVASSGGAANAGNAGRNAGAVTISGGAVTTLAITAAGSNGNGAGFAGGNGAAVEVAGNSGNVSVGAIATQGGNGAAGNAAGGNAGTITLDAGGATPTITLRGNLTATGGNRTGSGAAGSGAQVQLKRAALLNAATVTVNARGGSAGLGAGGAVRFDDAVDSTGGARALAVNTNGATTFGGAVGAASALQTVTTDAGGTVQINGGLVNTVGTQTYNEAVTTGGTTTLQTANAALTVASAVNATAGTLALATGSRNVTMTNAANDFGTVQVTSAGNVTLVDANALTFSNLNVGGNLTATSTGALNLGQGTVGGNLITSSNGGAITQTGALSVTGNSTLNAGNNSITLTNPGNNFVGAVSANNSGANNIDLVDANALTLGASSAGGRYSARALGSDLTLNGAISASGGGEAIVLAASGNFQNAGAFALNPGAGRYLVWSTDPALGNRGGLAHDFKQYNAVFGDPVLGSGNGFLYGVAPVITPGLAGAANRAYDGTVTAPTGGLVVSGTGAIDGDAVTLSATGATYNDKHVGSNKPVTVNGITLASATNGAATVFGYQLGATSAVASVGNITAAPLTVTAQAASRVYDGTTNSATAPVISGTIFDAISTAPIQTYDNKNVGSGKTLTASGLMINDGNGGNNYSISYVASTAGAITPAVIGSVTGITANNKVYDATTTAALNTGAAGFAGLIAGDTLTVAAANGAFADKNVGTGKAVNITGITLGGADSVNYTLTSNTATATANITPAAITGVSGIVANNKVYDATTAATLNTGAANFTGIIAGDTLTVGAASGAFGDKNVGTGKTVNISGISLGGADAGNYTLSSNTATTTANITPAAITGVSGIVANNKVYDATTAATLNTGTANFTGLIAGDTLTVGAASGAFTDKNVGTGKTVNISGIALGGADAGNYTLSSNVAIATANITPAAITNVSGILANNKGYDATAVATLNTGSVNFTGLIAGDTLSVASASGAFSDKNAGTGKTVNISVITLGGADAGNYTLASATATTTANITPATLSVTYGGVNKVYDGTTAATVTTSDDRFAGDALVINRNANFSSADAGAGKTVNVSAVSLAGADAANYVVASTGSTTADITPRALTISADNKSTTVGSPLPTFTASYFGFVPGETPANLAGTLAFATLASPASPPGAYAITPSGQSSNNYAVSYVNGTLLVAPGAGLIPADVLASIYGGNDQLPPRFVSGPVALPTSFAAVQPVNVTGTSVSALLAQASDNEALTAPGAGGPAAQREAQAQDERHPLRSGVVNMRVDVIDGGVRLPR